MRSYARFDCEYTVASVWSGLDAVLAIEPALRRGRLRGGLGPGADRRRSHWASGTRDCIVKEVAMLDRIRNAMPVEDISYE